MVEDIKKDYLHKNKKKTYLMVMERNKQNVMANCKDATFVEDKRLLFCMIYIILHILKVNKKGKDYKKDKERT